ncbi:hypothetical protein H0H87_009362 [Tephrocybe sp. NHM501043]|nr:hypothetical protein H0H87_009362 [Tephrocybe sp. NHM501043]
MADPLQDTPPHIISLLDRLHAESSAQESAITISAIDPAKFHDIMRDKFIALDKDKCHFVYQLSRTINAKTIVEAGTSYGVSTIYLALAVAANVAATGGVGTVIGTEYEAEKAQKAREHWKECGSIVSDVIDLREGDLRETLKENIKEVDLLLLDIWTPMALPTLTLIQPRMRYGAVVIVDNTIQAAERYKELLDYLRAPGSGFTNLTLPYSNGLEMCVYLPQ